jgi:hypothetical protein
MMCALAALANRVAKERGEDVGMVVGYSIHANRHTSRITRLTFCTTGILIRRLMIDPELASVTHVIIDEVHERGLEVQDEILKASFFPRVFARPISRIATFAAKVHTLMLNNRRPNCHPFSLTQRNTAQLSPLLCFCPPCTG